jgi:hypothetical protein
MISAETDTHNLLSVEKTTGTLLIKKSTRAVLELRQDGRVRLDLNLKGANEFTLIGFSVLTAQLLKIHWSRVSTNNVNSDNKNYDLCAEELMSTIDDITSLCQELSDAIIQAESSNWKTPVAKCLMDNGSVQQVDSGSAVKYEGVVFNGSNHERNKFFE